MINCLLLFILIMISSVTYCYSGTTRFNMLGFLVSVLLIFHGMFCVQYKLNLSSSQQIHFNQIGAIALSLA
jgi:hypothetical protein